MRAVLPAALLAGLAVLCGPRVATGAGTHLTRGQVFEVARGGFAEASLNTLDECCNINEEREQTFWETFRGRTSQLWEHGYEGGHEINVKVELRDSCGEVRESLLEEPLDRQRGDYYECHATITPETVRSAASYEDVGLIRHDGCQWWETGWASSVPRRFGTLLHKEADPMAPRSYAALCR